MYLISDVAWFCIAFMLGAFIPYTLQRKRECDEHTHSPKLQCNSCGKAITGLNLVNNKSVCPECGSENIMVLVHYILRDVPEPSTVDIPLNTHRKHKETQ